MTTIEGDGAGGTEHTVGALLGRCLRALGTTRVFGSARSGVSGIPGLGHLRVDEPELAALLADAVGRVSAGAHPGVALLPGRRLRIATEPGFAGPTLSLTRVDELPEVIAGFALDPALGAVEIELDVDLDAPAPEVLDPLTVNATGPLMTLSPSLAELGLVVVAGPGVVRAGAVDALRTFAARTGIGVLETYGARGLLPASQAEHWGTVGVQADDLSLAGLDDARIVVTVGLAGDEVPVERWARKQVLEVQPFQLEALAHQWPAEIAARPRPPLVDALAAVVDPLRESSATPLTPARAAADLRTHLRDGGLVAGDAGPAALWLLRALPVERPGQVVVPSRAVPGFAVAAAMVAALDERPATAVTALPRSPESQALLDLAARVGSRFTVIEWGADEPWSEATAHRVALRSAREAPGIAHVPVPVDLSATDALVVVAGEITAWPPPDRVL